jgi:hypothetical protein
MSYADFDAQVPAIEGTSLWRRQMVLGPTPEFALLSASPLPPADDFQALPLALAPIWPR